MDEWDDAYNPYSSSDDYAVEHVCKGCGMKIPDWYVVASKEAADKLVHVEDVGSFFGERYVPYLVECGPIQLSD